MKKLRLITMLSAFTLAAAGAFGLANSKNSKKAEFVSAAGSLVGGQSLFLKVENTNWTSSNAAFAVYVYNSSTDNSWAWFDSATAFSGDYKVATIPTGTWAKLIVCRMNPNGSDSSNNYLNWNNKWNQTDDITTISGDTLNITGSNWDSAAYSWSTFSSKHSFELWHSAETDGTWSITRKISLTYQNGSEGARFYNTNVSLDTGMKFDFVRDSSDWFHSDYLQNGGAVPDYFKKNGSNDGEVLHGGSFEVYLKVKDDCVWTQVSSSTEAEKWSKGFVEGVGCSNSYNAAPTNWSTYASSYSSLTSGAKNIMYSASGSNSPSATYVEKAVFMYDLCVSKYASCAANAFMVNSSGQARSVNRNVVASIYSNATNYAAIIIIVSLVSVTAIGGFFFIRKRKSI